MQFLSHPVLCDLLTDEDQKVSFVANAISFFMSPAIIWAPFVVQGNGEGCRYPLTECVYVFQVFKYLESLDVEDFKDVKSGYSIRFVSFCSNHELVRITR